MLRKGTPMVVNIVRHMADGRAVMVAKVASMEQAEHWAALWTKETGDEHTVEER